MQIFSSYFLRWIKKNFSLPPFAYRKRIDEDKARWAGFGDYNEANAHENSLELCEEADGNVTIEPQTLV